jgi:uncharacterized protein
MRDKYWCILYECKALALEKGEILSHIIRSIFFATLVLSWAMPVLAQSTITVQGQGMASSSPNLAVIRSGVVSHAISPSDAIAANNQAMSRLLSIATKFGIDDKDIQTSHFGLNPEYKHVDNQTPPLITGYRVSNQFTARLRDITKLGDFLDALVQGGANQISGITFEIEDAKALHTKARQSAAADAKFRAEMYAKEFGLTVGKPISIVEGSASPQQPMGLRTMSSQMAGQVPIAPGETTVLANVTVIFSID